MLGGGGGVRGGGGTVSLRVGTQNKTIELRLCGQIAHPHSPKQERLCRSTIQLFHVGQLMNYFKGEPAIIITVTTVGPIPDFIFQGF